MDSGIDKQLIQKLKQNNKQIEKLLSENEQIIKKAGFEPPKRNVILNKEDRIALPSGYIRLATRFITQYHLDEIVNDSNIRKNIAYSIQLMDLYNYLFNRFNIWGSIMTMFVKTAIVNVVSITEALISECASNIRMVCFECKKAGRCENQITKNEQDYVKNCIAKMTKLNILSLDAEKVERLNEIIDLRNRVHIRLAKENEFMDSSFCLSTYNEIKQLLQVVVNDLYTNGVPAYKKCNSKVEEVAI